MADSPAGSFTSIFLVLDRTRPFFFALPPYSPSFSAFWRFALGFDLVYSTLSSSLSSSLSFSSSGVLISSIILANPKSQILTTSPCPLISTLAGLRSLCTTSAEWRYFSLHTNRHTRRVFDREWSEHLQSRRKCYHSWRLFVDRYRRIKWWGRCDRNCRRFGSEGWGPRSSWRCWDVCSSSIILFLLRFFVFLVGTGRGWLFSWWPHKYCHFFWWP